MSRLAQRALLVLLCVALFAVAAGNASGPSVEPSPVICAAALAVCIAGRPRPTRPQCQPLSFLSLDSSRAPPLA